MPLNDIGRTLLNQNVMVLEGEVDRDMRDLVRESLLLLEARGCPDVEVRITSNGGGTIISLQICDMFRRYRGKKTGVVYNFARSAAATILQACDDRVCLPHAVVLIHHVVMQQVSLDTLQSKRGLAQLKQLMLADQRALYDLLVTRTGRTLTEVRAVCRKNADMTAQEALKFGLIDRIIKF